MKKTKHKHQLESVPILKGDKRIGTNYYCKKINCHYEYDTTEKEVRQ